VRPGGGRGTKPPPQRSRPKGGGGEIFSPSYLFSFAFIFIFRLPLNVLYFLSFFLLFSPTTHSGGVCGVERIFGPSAPIAPCFMLCGACVGDFFSVLNDA